MEGEKSQGCLDITYSDRRIFRLDFRWSLNFFPVKATNYQLKSVEHIAMHNSQLREFQIPIICHLP